MLSFSSCEQNLEKTKKKKKEFMSKSGFPNKLNMIVVMDNIRINLIKILKNNI
jgi:hypothetical protein